MAPGEDEIKFSYVAEKGEYHWRSSFEGLVPMIERRYRETENPEHRAELEAYMSAEPCPACKGRRLKPEALAVKVGGRAIDEVSSETISDVDRVLRGPAAVAAREGDRRARS